MVDLAGHMLLFIESNFIIKWRFGTRLFRQLALLVVLSLPYTYLQAEEVLRMLVWEGYAPFHHIKKFEQYILKKYAHPVRIEVTNISDPNQFFDFLRGQRVDVISPTHNLLKDERFNFIENELILPIDMANIPNYHDIIPDLQNADYATKNDKVYAIPFVHGPYGLAYNTQLVKDEPKSWNALWGPQYQNRYSISGDYYEVNIYITALALGYHRDQLHQYEVINNKTFKQKLKQLAHHAYSFWEGVDTADDLVGLPIATSWGFSFPELKQRGEQWKLASPKEGTMGWVDNYSIGHSLKHKPFLKRIAEEWLNYVLSPEFQIDAVARGIGSAPVNLTIKNELTTEEIIKFHMNEPNYFKLQRIMWPTLSSRNRNGLKLLWNEASKDVKAKKTQKKTYFP